MKAIYKLYKLKKNDKIFIDNKPSTVLQKEKTSIPEHKPLNEEMIWLTNKRMIIIDKNGYSLYKVIEFRFFIKFRFLLRIRKKVNIRF